MTVEETYLKGSYIITPEIYKDSRGEFFESFNQQDFERETGLNVEFVQDNQSTSKRHALRGLHFQTEPHQQAKLVRVIKGEVLDICVDLRQDSETFGDYFSIVLNSSNNKQLFVPRGFAHGFLTLSESAIFCYKCDRYYNQESERGIIYNDKDLNINWEIKEDTVLLSEKDKNLPTFKSLFK